MNSNTRNPLMEFAFWVTVAAIIFIMAECSWGQNLRSPDRFIGFNVHVSGVQFDSDGSPFYQVACLRSDSREPWDREGFIRAFTEEPFSPGTELASGMATWVAYDQDRRPSWYSEPMRVERVCDYTLEFSMSTMSPPEGFDRLSWFKIHGFDFEGASIGPSKTVFHENEVWSSTR